MSILIMLVLLSFLILIHEAGHFLAAKMFNIKVEKFGFGLPIGPTLFKKQIGDLTILVHAFLLGGYVAFPDDDEDCDLPKDSDERFLNKPIYQRAIVVSAGVFANVVCAYLIILFAAFHWGYMPAGKYDIFVNEITAEKTASVWKSGLQKDDKIVSINNTPITNVNSILSIISNSKAYDGFYSKALADENLAKLKELNLAYTDDEVIPSGVTIKLPEKKYETTISLSKETEKGITKYKNKDFKLDENLTNLRDTLKSNPKYFVGNDVYTLSDVAKALSDNNHPLYFVVNRNGKNVTLNEFYPDEKGKIGVKFAQKEILIPTKDMKSIFKIGTKYLWDKTYSMVYGLGQIFTGNVPLKDVHGIVAITKLGGDIIKDSGMFYGLLLTAIISMDLAIVNFIPIPALDGGHVLFLIIEKIRGKRLNDETVEKIGTFFFSILIALMVIIIFNDILWLKH